MIFYKLKINLYKFKIVNKLCINKILDNILIH